MKEIVENTVYYGVAISLICYYIGVKIKQRLKKSIYNPLLISIFLTLGIILIFNLDWKKFCESSNILTYLLTPATIALAIPLYEQFGMLKKNYKAVLIGILSGVIINFLSIYGFCLLFEMGHQNYVTLIPKSITNAIAMELSRELGGFPSVTVVAVLITGIFGNLCADWVCKVFRIKHPIAKGVALGTSAHAMGTSKALEFGPTEGAMGSLSIVVTGILTVALASLFANWV